MKAWLAVGIGGFMGAIARYYLSVSINKLSKTNFPAGTLVVNVLGCVLIGMLWNLFETRQWLTPNLRLVVITGFLGSFSTFSTFSHETMVLIQGGQTRHAFLNILGNLTLCLLAVLTGRSMAKWLF